MRHSQHQVFSDISGKRWKRVKQVAFGSAFILSLLGTIFSFSLLALPISPLPIAKQGLIPSIVNKEQAARQFLARRTKAKLSAQIEHERRRKTKAHGKGTGAPYSTVVAFYVNWNEPSYNSISDHIGSLTYVMAEWYYLPLYGPELYKSHFGEQGNANDAKLKDLCHREDVPIIVLMQNVDRVHPTDPSGMWQWEPLKKLLLDKPRQLQLAMKLRDDLLSNHYGGINIDFEVPIQSLPESEQAVAKKIMHDELPDFMQTLHSVFAPAHLLVTQDLPAPTDYSGAFYDYDALNDINDFVVVMLYDQHNAGSDVAGPIAAQEWVEDMAQAVFAKMDSSKVVLGIGAYSLDWPVKSDKNGNPVELGDGFAAAGTAKGMALSEVLNNAREWGADVEMDDTAVNPYQFYVDPVTGQQHLVYCLDAVTAYNQIMALKGYEPRGAALWMPGREDPSIWSFFAEGKLGKPVPLSSLENMAFPDSEAVIQGQGEILEVIGNPSPGTRELTLDSDGLIT